jgi:TorA maturation chaperone TorD
MKAPEEKKNRPAWHEPHAGIRTDSYALLGALLTAPPSRVVLSLVKELDWGHNLPADLQDALAELSRCGSTVPEAGIAAEYNRLFVGLGSGELVPYASWYRDKIIQSTPLAAVRSDLVRLGIARQPGTSESEDHAGALCEVMALLSVPGNVSDSWQGAFFGKHILPWMMQFFTDMRKAAQTPFYSAVAGFGSVFLAWEKEYLEFTVREYHPERPSQTPTGTEYAEEKTGHCPPGRSCSIENNSGGREHDR